MRNFRAIPYFLSQYSILIAIVLIFIVPSQSTAKYVADSRHCSSSKGEKWSNDYEPDYFYHLTDIHITHYLQSTQDNFDKSLKIGAFFKPKTVLITGDLVDDYYLPYFPDKILETKQIKKDWDIYHTIAEKYENKFDKFIESLGNHDIPRILSKESNNFFYKNYTIISQSHHNFSMPNDTYDIFTEKVGNFTFVILNPVFFPIPPLPFNYYVHAPNEYIEKVETVINSISEKENVIIATHYQGPVWSPVYVPFIKSTTTTKFLGSILQEKKVKILITGHNHGDKRMIMHHRDSFEICASDLRYNLKGGMVTNDNGNVVYHWFSINNPTKSFITFPSPVDQTTSRTDCSVAKVRVISFRDDVDDLFIEIDGNKIRLNPVKRLENNNDCWLLEADLFSISKGKHHIKLIGEDEEEFDFLFGASSKINSKTELLYDDMMWSRNQYIGLIFLTSISIFTTFPFSICSYTGYWKWINKFDEINDKKNEDKETMKTDEKKKIIPKTIETNEKKTIIPKTIETNEKKTIIPKTMKTNEKKTIIPKTTETKLNVKNKKDDHKELTNKKNRKDNIIYWIVSIFFGPLGIRSRLLQLPICLRVLLFISILISPFLPLFIFEVGDRVGFMFSFGFFLGVGKGNKTKIGGSYISHVYGAYELRYEEWCPFIGLLFFSSAVMPTILAASSFGLMPSNRKESLLQLVDVFVHVGGFIGGLLLAFRSFMLLCERTCALYSPFVLFPLFWLMILSTYFYIRRMKRC